MPFRFLCVGVLATLLLLFFDGCVMRRTVTEDGIVVRKGYVIKDPL